MDTTDSSEETSSDYSTESSEDDDMEMAEINGTKLQLPQGLCDKKEIFLEVLSGETWNSFSDTTKQHLQTFLPNFPENDDDEKSKTLQKLFDCDTFKFNNPLDKFHDDLKAGYYRPDIANMRRVILKTERKEAAYRYKKYRENLKRDLIESRDKLLQQIRTLPPGTEPKVDRRADPNLNSVVHKTKRRYFQVLSAIRSKTEDGFCSPDENYPEGPPVSLSRKQRRHLTTVKNSYLAEHADVFASTMTPGPKSNSLDVEKYITPSKNPFYVTDEAYKNMLSQHKRRKVNHWDDGPEFNTKDITITDIVNRTQLPYIKNLASCRVKSSSTSSKKKVKRVPISTSRHHSSNSDAESDSDSVVDSRSIVKNRNHSLHIVSSTSSRKPTKVRLRSRSHATRVGAEKSPSVKVDKPPTVKVEKSTTVKVEKVSNVKVEKPPSVKVEKPNLESPIVTMKAVTTPKVATTIAPIISTVTMPIAPVVTFTTTPSSAKVEPVAVTMPDLEVIDMMEIPIDLGETSEIDIMQLNNKPELMQDTHSNFLSLIRDIFCSTNEHRMSLKTLETRLRAWQENPISPLNDWYSLTDNWLNLLQSAIAFLCGNSLEQPEDFVPYMEYKTSLDMYQWIGAGRDNDLLLSSLCSYWLEHRAQRATTNRNVVQYNPPPVAVKEEKISVVKEDIVSNVNPSQEILLVVAKKEETARAELSDISQPPPPPRCPTNWSVRKLTPDEISYFREQERRRYDNPYKAFTFHCFGYESVVGPLKGMYNPAVSTSSKARGHTLLNPERPNFVTILSLVRDATARLPNGEGTRAEICELLKSSQYLLSTAPENILQSVVSGALDRMHTQFDPCVKYDPKKKIWIYLHRNRTELDFERLHQQYQGVPITKPKKTPTKKPSRSKAKGERSKSLDDKEKKVPPTNSVVERGGLVATNKNSLLISNQESHALTTMSEEQEINEALQSIVIQTTAPVATPSKAAKNVVKIISPSSQSHKSGKESKSTAKQINQSQMVTQHLLQSIQNKQKQQQQQQKQQAAQIVVGKSGDDKFTFIQPPLSQQQQSQLSGSVKNVTLVRGVANSQEVKVLPDQQQQQIQQQQIKTHQGTLSPAMQHQIIQTIKHKIIPHGGQQQQQQPQIILKQQGQQQGKMVHKQILAAQAQPQTPQSKLESKTMTTASSPVVAKVLTNAAGQVISVESLLAHQKQHGSLPQGTTLRVSGTKGGTANIIHLTGASATATANTAATKQNTIAAQFSPNNIILTTSQQQPKLVVSSTPSVMVTAPPLTVMTSASAPSVMKQTKFAPQKIAHQQLINAKLITTTTDGQKIIQPKILMTSSQPQSKMAAGAATGSIRMVNAANLNLTHIGGKPVLLAAKGQGQNVILQNAVKSTNLITQPNVVLGPQLKHQQVVFGSNINVKGAQSQGNAQGGHIVLEGHPVRLQTSNASASTSRVLLASQGQGGQILAQQFLLPAGFQGTAINIKALQGVKVIPLAHAQARGVQGKQVFARVMSPSVVKAAPSTSTEQSSESVIITSSPEQ